jgi:5-formyltetrahydrofolate cyclo-ligase
MLLLMPGVAFDVYGNRMGYGKGFYDRFLRDKELLQTFSIAIGYKCQRVDFIPVEEHDLKSYQVILV